jgi:hypothetical protein
LKQRIKKNTRRRITHPPKREYKKENKTKQGFETL